MKVKVIKRIVYYKHISVLDLYEIHSNTSDFDNKNLTKNMPIVFRFIGCAEKPSPVRVVKSSVEEKRLYTNLIDNISPIIVDSNPINDTTFSEDEIVIAYGEFEIELKSGAVEILNRVINDGV